MTPDSPPLPYTAVLLDLDGTIVDSAPGIIGSLRHMFTELGLTVPHDDELIRWVGPPMLESLEERAGFTGEEAWRALTVYRSHYRAVGLQDAIAFDGILDVIRAIRSANLPLSLATSKPESAAHVILDDLGVTDQFTFVTGASEDESRSEKADVVAEALRRLTEAGADLSRPVHVGDRIHDVTGAAAHDVPVIFAEWGYGDLIEATDAVALAATPADLRALLGL